MNQFRFMHSAPATAFLFPGQGGQHVGMAKALCNQYPAARLALEEADDLLGVSISTLCFEGPEELLTDTVNAQPAILAASIAALRGLQSELDELADDAPANSSPRFVAGHSFGEYTALVAAGAISYADGLRLVRERGRVMKEAGTQNPGKMAAILGLDGDKIAEICTEISQGEAIVQVANDNCPGQVVISGDQAGMDAAMEALRAAGARKVVPLAVSIAAHSPLMKSAAAELQIAIEATPITEPCFPLIANTSARPIQSAADIRAELIAQLTGSVRWTESMQHALAAGVTNFVEIGPGEALTGMIKRIDRSAARLNVNEPGGVTAFADWLRGAR
ncbi:MAG: ACP S-malonyltransferase [Caldilineaceae bacterium]